MRETFRQCFKKNNDRVELYTFTRDECLQYFNVADQDSDIEVIGRILESSVMKKDFERTALFLDETSLSGTLDWSKLENSNPSVSLIISFQPMVEAYGSNLNTIQLQFPTSNHVNINLIRCYRTSTSILKSLQSFHDLSIKRLETDVEAVDLVSGQKPRLLAYDTVNENLKIWLHITLSKLQCQKDQLTILYTDETKEDAFQMFPNDSQFHESLLHWKEFVGCEKPAIICFYSSTHDDVWQLFHIASRAQQQVKHAKDS